MSSLATVLAEQIIDLLQATIVVHRPQWGPLTGHRRSYEAWWKAQFALAIESWIWSSECSSFTGFLPEAKPRDFGLGSGQQAVDLLVAPWDPKSGESGDFVRDKGPRVWIELKERGTWWGRAEKGLGKANHGLLHDLEKWGNTFESAGDDVLLCCHLLSHNGAGVYDLPPDWREALADLRQQFKSWPPFFVGFPTTKGTVRWLTMDVFQVSPRTDK